MTAARRLAAILAVATLGRWRARGHVNLERALSPKPITLWGFYRIYTSRQAGRLPVWLGLYRLGWLGKAGGAVQP